MKKKKLVGTLIIIVCVLICASGISAYYLQDNKSDLEADIIVKDNVYTITEETEEELHPVSVEDDVLVFASNPKFKENDVIVAGIIDSAPNGFIRKVKSVQKENDLYIVETENAVLTDVFEKANISKQFLITEDGILDISETQSTAINTTTIGGNTLCIEMPTTKFINLASQLVTNTSKEKKSDYQFNIPFKYEGVEGISVSGEVGLSIWVDLTIIIENEEVQFGVTANFESGGDVLFGYTESEEKEFVKLLYKTALPTIQFNAGPIPIVLSNELLINLEGDIYLSGDIGTSFEIKDKHSAGFMYTSSTNEVKEIRESKYYSDGVKWQTGAKAVGEESVGVFIHLKTLLYDSTGADISVGIEGSAKGEVSVGINHTNNSPEFIGKLDLAIRPKFAGALVVSVPIIDKQLAERPLFEIELKPLWEDSWSSGSDWKEQLESLEPIVLNNTYTTRLRSVDMVSAPEFCFDYPEGWNITEEHLHMSDNIYEQDVLSNDRGIEIIYMDYNGNLGGYGREMIKVKVTKICDSSFKPINYVTDSEHPDYTNYGNYIVAKIKTIGTLDMDTDAAYTEIDGDSVYAIVPEELIGVHSDIRGLSGLVEFCSFDFPSDYSFIAMPFSEEISIREEQEIIEILSSFRESNYEEY